MGREEAVARVIASGLCVRLPKVRGRLATLLATLVGNVAKVALATFDAIFGNAGNG